MCVMQSVKVKKKVGTRGNNAVGNGDLDRAGEPAAK